jgi:site-specific DNA recombinase
MAADPGPSFRWGALKRRSAYNPDGTEGSTARQEDAIFSYVKQHDMGRIVAVYSDIASAFNEKAKRPEYDNALLDLQAGRTDGIIVWKLDRLTRRRNQMRRILTLLEDCGGRLFSVVEGVDTADPAKKEVTELVLNVYIGAAQAESEAIGERVRLLHYDRARKGLVQWPGRPFGHSQDGTSLVLPEVKILHEAGERILADEAAFSIARDLTRREIPTSRGHTRWHSEQLRRILQSPRMIGKREYGGELYEMQDVPSIFDEETWQRICDKLAQRTHSSGPVEKRLLSTIALCGVCGRTLTSAIPKSGKFCYACKPHSEGDGACRKISVLGEQADMVVREKVIEFIADKERVTKLLRQHGGKELDAIQGRIAELSDSLHALAQALNPPPGVPRMPLQTYYEQAATIDAERKELHQSMAITREAAMLADLHSFEDVPSEWDARPLHWQRAILKLVTKRIVVEPRGKASVLPGFNVFDPSRVVVTFA